MNTKIETMTEEQRAELNVKAAAAYIIYSLEIGDRPSACGMVYAWARALDAGTHLDCLLIDEEPMHEFRKDNSIEDLTRMLRPVVGGGRLLIVNIQARAIVEDRVEFIENNPL